jgi:outer membrane receptor for ferrienterochelin and colicins
MGLSIFAPVLRLPGIFLLAVLCIEAPAQDSIASRQLEQLVVTATRNERTMGALPMPVTLVQKSQIKMMGSLRLQDVLAEQTGLAVVQQVNGQGNGLQLQGFNPDYTLILIDGEPLIGRNTGSLELSRVSVGNIRQIEIVKGPSSSLYGSDALAGVVNIITDRPRETRGSFYSRYGTNNTLDLSGDIGHTIGKVGIYAFVNRYSTDGYDLSPENFGKTVSPFSNYTANAKVTWKLSPKTDLNVSGRYFNERQDFNYEVTTPSAEKIRTSGNGMSNDWNFNPVLVHRFGSRLKTTARLYYTHYQTATHLNQDGADTLYYKDDFDQTFTRPEVNAEYYFSDKNILTAGAGEAFESVQTSRYGDEATRRQQTRYAFFQEEWSPVKKLKVIAGGRYDFNSTYGSQFSPKLSGRYEIKAGLVLKGSFGIGFKAPDFRQLYFNFNNSAGGGYSVLGTEVVGDRLAQLEAQGQIQVYLFDPALIGKLDAERSKAVNLGMQAIIAKKVSLDANLFYNSIDNLIETQAVAVTTANQTIYSYRNIKRAYTGGLELNATVPLAKNLNLSTGYQLLYAKDKDVADQVSKGEVFWRDPETLATYRLKSSEYFGLYNRSRHMANVKLFYVDRERGWEGSMRVIYRGKYGVGDIRGNIQGETIPASDINGNSILDTHDQFVNGYAVVNLSIARTFAQSVRLQLGVDNLFDHTDKIYIPNLPGRLLYLSVGYSFTREKIKP